MNETPNCYTESHQTIYIYIAVISRQNMGHVIVVLDDHIQLPFSLGHVKLFNPLSLDVTMWAPLDFLFQITSLLKIYIFHLQTCAITHASRKPMPKSFHFAIAEHETTTHPFTGYFEDSTQPNLINI